MRLAVFTHTFPPSRHSNAKRPFYVVKGFLAAGWQVDVFSSTLAMETGAPETVSHPGLRIFRCPDPVGRLRRRFARNPLLEKLFILSVAGTIWPDYFAPWAKRVLAMYRQQPACDRELGFVLPVSVLLSGRVPGIVGRNWTFDYQESVSPQYRRHSRRSPLQRLRLPRLAQLERETLHQAGRVIFTADTNRRAYIDERLVAETATAHVPYFFDAEVFNQPAPPTAPEFAITYFGTFDWRGARSPETFLQALAKFLRRHPEARPRTKFIFYGSWLQEHHRWIDALQLRDVVSIYPAVSYANYLERVKQSPVLLLVVSAAHNLFMPSKIVDYFGARRPILAFVPRDSEMRRVLEAAGMAKFVSDESDTEAGATALENLWARYQSGTLAVSADKAQFWSSTVQIPRYLELVTRSP
jgi:glycosyltransferase involved in cell wall biosynthesis